MKVRKTLMGLVRIIAEEAERNPDFEFQLRSALGIIDERGSAASRGNPKNPTDENSENRRRNRRPSAVLDPIHLARQSEETLRLRLQKLDFEELRDIVAEYGMDPGKVVMKWRDRDRIADRIVELSIARAQKGSAFRD